MQQGVALPLIGLALGLAGPLDSSSLPALQRRLGRNDLRRSVGRVARGGSDAQRPRRCSTRATSCGRHMTWLLRLLQLAVAVPLLWAGVGGAVAGAFWLRYRGLSAHGRHPLMGRPFLAFVVAGGFVVAAAIAQILLVLWVAVLTSLALGVVALVWLRQLIHVGLRSEAAEIAEGAVMTCANCGEGRRATPSAADAASRCTRFPRAEGRHPIAFDPARREPVCVTDWSLACSAQRCSQPERLPRVWRSPSRPRRSVRAFRESRAGVLRRRLRGS